MILRRLRGNLVGAIRTYYTVKTCPVKENKEVNIAKHLHNRIKMMGPITVADYMKEVLTSPVEGYYIKGEGIGAGIHST